MSQAALNTRNSEEEVSSRRNNGTRLAGILFLLTVLTTVLVSGWVVLGWMEDAQRLPLSKLVLRNVHRGYSGVWLMAAW